MKSFWYGMLIGATIAFLLMGSNLHAEERYYYNDYGQPQGSSNQVGNTTYYNGPYGQPRGSASTYGNTTYYYNQYGQPQGSATTVAPGNTQPVQPTWNPYIGGKRQ